MAVHASELTRLTKGAMEGTTRRKKRKSKRKMRTGKSKMLKGKRRKKA